LPADNRSKPSPTGRPDTWSNVNPADAQPADLKIKLAEQTLRIQWQDGRDSVFDLGQLRRHCPCATCREQRADTSPLPVLNINTNQAVPTVTSARLVGNYALQLVWSDGHDAGIFDFRYLRFLACGGQPD